MNYVRLSLVLVILLSAAPLRAENYTFVGSAEFFEQQTGARVRSGAMPALGNLSAAARQDVRFGWLRVFPLAPSSLFVADWTPAFAGNEIALNGVENFDLRPSDPTRHNARWYSVGFEIADASPPGTPGFVSFAARFCARPLPFENCPDEARIDSRPFSVTRGGTNHIGFWLDQPFAQVSIRETIPDDDNQFFGRVWLGERAQQPNDSLRLSPATVVAESSGQTYPGFDLRARDHDKDGNPDLIVLGLETNRVDRLRGDGTRQGLSDVSLLGQTLTRVVTAIDLADPGEGELLDVLSASNDDGLRTLLLMRLLPSDVPVLIPYTPGDLGPGTQRVVNLSAIDIDNDDRSELLMLTADADAQSGVANGVRNAFYSGSSESRLWSDPLPAAPRCMTAADFDGDARIDLAFGDSSERNPGSGQYFIEVRRANGVNSVFPSAFPCRQLLAPDFDGDGHPDLVVLTDPDPANPQRVGPGRLQILIGDQSPTGFSPLTLINALRPVYAMQIADMDRDGRQDVVFALRWGLAADALSVAILRRSDPGADVPVKLDFHLLSIELQDHDWISAIDIDDFDLDGMHDIALALRRVEDDAPERRTIAVIYGEPSLFRDGFEELLNYSREASAR